MEYLLFVNCKSFLIKFYSLGSDGINESQNMILQSWKMIIFYVSTRSILAVPVTYVYTITIDYGTLL